MVLQWIKLFAVAVFDRLAPFRRNQFRGDYANWDIAALACREGYAHQSIFEKVKHATQDVIDGRAVFERDSVTFHHEEYNWPLLTILWQEARDRGRPVTVMDFGGALGSTYFQNRKLLQRLNGLRWCVIEQPHYVACGREKFETECLRFYSSVSECLSHEKVNVALFSSVLAYLPNPWQVLSEVARAGISTVFIDETQVLDHGEKDRIVIQSVPSYIYKARYPMRFFTAKSLLRGLIPKYECDVVFGGFGVPSVLLSPLQIARYKGFVLRKQETGTFPES